MTADPAAKPDRGASGPALAHRPSHMHTVKEGRARAFLSSERTEEIEVKRYLDGELWDRMWRAGQLSDLQHSAAERFARLFIAAGLHPRLSSHYGARALGGRALIDDGDGAEPSPLDIYRRAARASPFSGRIEAMVLGRHPGVRWLATLQAGLDWYARSWGLKLEDWEDEG